MNGHHRKNAFISALAVSLMLSLSSCGNSSVSWDDSENFPLAKELESSYHVEGESLKITVLNQDHYLHDVAKDKIILRDASRTVESSSRNLSGKDLLDTAIKDYNLEVGEEKLTITIDHYEDTLYYVIFNKAATSDARSPT